MRVHYRATESLGEGTPCALGQAADEGVILIAADTPGLLIAGPLESLLQAWADGAWMYRDGDVLVRVKAVVCLPAGVDVALVEGDGEVAFLVGADSPGSRIAQGMQDVAVPWVEEMWVHVGWAGHRRLRPAS